jgi:hypothetical protein
MTGVHSGASRFSLWLGERKKERNKERKRDNK